MTEGPRFISKIPYHLFLRLYLPCLVAFLDQTPSGYSLQKAPLAPPKLREGEVAWKINT